MSPRARGLGRALGREWRLGQEGRGELRTKKSKMLIGRMSIERFYCITGTDGKRLCNAVYERYLPFSFSAQPRNYSGIQTHSRLPLSHHTPTIHGLSPQGWMSPSSISPSPCPSSSSPPCFGRSVEGAAAGTGAPGSTLAGEDDSRRLSRDVKREWRDGRPSDIALVVFLPLFHVLHL